MKIKVTEVNVYILDVVDHVGENLDESGNEDAAIETAKEWYENEPPVHVVPEDMKKIFKTPGVLDVQMRMDEGGVEFDIFEEV